MNNLTQEANMHIYTLANKVHSNKTNELRQFKAN